MHRAAQRQFVKLWHIPFLRHNTIAFAGALAIGFFNYLFYPVIGRLLDPSAFGEVQAVISLYGQLTIVLGVLNLLIVNVVANQADETAGAHFVAGLERAGLMVAVPLALVASLGSGLMRDFLHFTSAWPFVVALAAMVAAVPMTLRMAFLQARKRFGALTATGLVYAVGSLVSAAAFISLGFGSLGAPLGVLAGQVAAVVYATLQVRQSGWGRPAAAWPKPADKSSHPPSLLPEIGSVKPYIRYALAATAVSLSLTLVLSIDVVLVKHYFNPHDAGLYAGLAVVARIIFFVTGSIASVMLPSVQLDAPAGQNQRLFRNSLVLLMAGGGAGLLLFALLPQLIVGLLLGQAYTEYARLLPLLGLAVYIISIVSLWLRYHLALRQYFITWVAAAGVAVTGSWILLRHGSLLDVIAGLLAGAGVMLVILALRTGRIWLHVRFSESRR